MAGRRGQVPENLRGFEDRHEGRLLTVFTASNYCGSTGNYGAVVVFQARRNTHTHTHMFIFVHIYVYICIYGRSEYIYIYI